MSHTSRRNSPRGKFFKRTLGGIVTTVLLVLASSCGTESKKQEQVVAKPPAPAAPAALLFSKTPKIHNFKPFLPTVKSTKGPSKGKTRIEPRGITLHWWSYSSNGNIEGLYKVLRKNKNSVQFGITKDGAIYQMMRSPKSFARHATGGNDTTIGIEIEGEPKDFALPGKPGFNKKKFEAVVSLTAKLVRDYDIPLNGSVKCHYVEGIHGHHEYNHCREPDAGDKEDTGPAYTQAVKDAVKNMQR